jgi:hypothetical protein
MIRNALFASLIALGGGGGGGGGGENTEILWAGG